jgi:hypothetical protein
MLFPGGFTFVNFLTDVVSIFIFVPWFCLLITVFGDLFRRRDISEAVSLHAATRSNLAYG